MKRVLILLIVLMAVASVAAQDRFTADISYWGGITTHYTLCPRAIAAGNYTVVATIFTPTAPVSLLNGFNVILYQAAQVGNLDVKAEVWAVDPVTGLPTGMFPLASQTILFANLLWSPTPTYFDFTASALSFAQGQKFCLAISAPTAVIPTTYITPMLNNTLAGHSYRFFTTGTTLGWVPYAGEFAFTASVEYNVPMQDVAARNLWFTGDFFLQPGDTVTYEADVGNLGEMAHTDVPVYLEVYDLATPATPIWTDVEYVTLAVGDTLHHIATFAPYTYPSTIGEYKVVLRTALATDMINTNDQIDLEQQTVILPDLLDYDDGTGETAHAWYVAGDGWFNSFNFYAAPVKLTSVSFNIRDNTWPTGVVGNEFLRAAVYADDGLGAPGALLYDSGIVACTLGAWNIYDVSASNLTFAAGETFYVGYIQVGDYPNCPGLYGDQTPPFACWSMSWDLYGGVWYTPDAYDEDMMIRAHVESYAAIEAPIISIALVGGYPTVTWAAVSGALSYNVYGSIDPFAADPWTLLTPGGITGTSYQYLGTEYREFFKVTAATNANGTKAMDPVMSTMPIAERSTTPRLSHQAQIQISN